MPTAIPHLSRVHIQNSRNRPCDSDSGKDAREPQRGEVELEYSLIDKAKEYQDAGAAQHVKAESGAAHPFRQLLG